VPRPLPRALTVASACLLAGALVAGCKVPLPHDASDTSPSPTAPNATATPPAPARLPHLPRQLDLSKANRRSPLPGLPDWSKAGYRDGSGLPTSGDMTTDAKCVITAGELANEYGVAPDDGKDDSAGLQRAVDAIKRSCSPQASYERLSLLSLPAGEIDVSRQLAVDADYLVIRGAGADPSKGTRLVFRPDANTRYDALTKDGSDWDEDGMKYKSGKGGWIWPGRGLFRVQSREVDESYREDYESAPPNRKDIFEGTVNMHWKSGAELAEKAGDPGFAARTGDTVVQLKDRPDTDVLRVGGSRRSTRTRRRSRSTSHWSSTSPSTRRRTVRRRSTATSTSPRPRPSSIRSSAWVSRTCTSPRPSPGTGPARRPTTTATSLPRTRCTGSSSSGRSTAGCAVSPRT
jgi:hypothetical protein